MCHVVQNLFAVLTPPCFTEARSEVPHSKKVRCSANSTVPDSLGALFEVLMSKNCTLLWRKAHLKPKNIKHYILGALLEVLMSKKIACRCDEKHISKSKMLKN